MARNVRLVMIDETKETQARLYARGLLSAEERASFAAALQEDDALREFVARLSTLPVNQPTAAPPEESPPLTSVPLTQPHPTSGPGSTSQEDLPPDRCYPHRETAGPVSAHSTGPPRPWDFEDSGLAPISPVASASAAETPAAPAGRFERGGIPYWLPWFLATCLAVICVLLLTQGPTEDAASPGLKQRLEEAEQRNAELKSETQTLQHALDELNAKPELRSRRDPSP